LDSQHTDTTPAACAEGIVPAESTIAADLGIDVDPGGGAGVFIEYVSGGHWSLRTSCDSATSNTSCDWDIIVTPEDGQTLSNAAGSDLEPDDSFLPYGSDGSYQFVATTASDFDGASFDTGAGAAVRVDAYLGRVCALQYFFWMGDSALHRTSPTNPLVLIPSVP
jgi:hypothetical protein